MRSERNFVMMKFLVVEVRGPSQSVQLGGGLLGSKWYNRTLQPRRWGSFLMRHCDKRRSLVCGSLLASERRVILVWTSLSCSLKNSQANVGDPTGEPRRRKPVVSSARIGGAKWSDLLGWREYFAMVLGMEASSVGSRLERVLSGEWPDVDINMRVFKVLTKHPSGLLRVLKWSQRNSRSSRGTQAETLSTKSRRCVMPPARHCRVCRC